MKSLGSLLALLNKIADALSTMLRNKRQAEKERSNEQLKDDPAGWYRDHFNGVSDSSSNATNASKASDKPASRD